MKRKRIIIIGAAGRDFHNFNTCFRNNPEVEVVAFTAAQIPGIDDREYPPELSGTLYPEGIPIFPETELHRIINDFQVDECVFSYSDVPYSHVMHTAAKVNQAGASFSMPGCRQTMLKSNKPVIAVGAVRTGCGKSQTSRKIIELLMQQNLKVVAIRHPMPYGNLVEQKVQRYAKIDDLVKHNCTIEEMEEYEPHIIRKNVIYAGVDYEAILHAAENDPRGCNIILWDGGNNDFPFYKPDLMITVTDPHRKGHEFSYYPGEITLRIADVVIINKTDTSNTSDIQEVKQNIKTVNPYALIIEAASPVTVDNENVIKDKRVLVIEDGPTVTHGGMKTGAGTVAAQKFGASEVVDPRPFLSGKLKDTFKKYPGIGTLLPAMGYGNQQVRDLEKTINNTVCDSVIIGTPIDLNRIIKINKPNTRMFYSLQETYKPGLNSVLSKFIKEKYYIQNG